MRKKNLNNIMINHAADHDHINAIKKSAATHLPGKLDHGKRAKSRSTGLARARLDQQLIDAVGAVEAPDGFLWPTPVPT